MAKYGADVGQLRELATRLAHAADNLETLGLTLGRQLGAAPWRGPDSERFRADWHGAHAKSLAQVAAQLRAAGTTLRTNADEQERASQADGGAGAASGALAGAAGAAATVFGANTTSGQAAGVGAAVPSGTMPPGSWRGRQGSDGTLRGLVDPDRPQFNPPPGMDRTQWPFNRKPAEVTAWWNGLSDEERARWLHDAPDLVGNTDGIPFSDRIHANRTNLDRALEREREKLAKLEARGASQKEIDKVKKHIADWECLRSNYVDVDAGGNLAAMDGRKLIGFDPNDQVHIELIGELNDETTAIGVLVPGTGTDIYSMEGTLDKARAFSNQSGGSLAMVAWLGGDMPHGAEALDNSYAKDLGPKLAHFVEGFDNPNGLPITVAGHSYGGPIVGSAEANGMAVDRILHIESVGAGPGVDSVDDYAKPDTPRYCLEAPMDPLLSGNGVIGHGADPSELKGMYQMETGWVDAEHSKGVLEGLAAHEGVFIEGSTAYWNMYYVLTGEGAVELESGTSPGFDWNPFDGGFGPRVDNGFEAADYQPHLVPVE